MPTLLNERFQAQLDDLDFDAVSVDDRGGAQNWTKGEGGLFTGSKPGGAKAAADPRSPAALEARAKQVFGVTDDMHETGYITPDGTRLDFSGRHQAAGYVRVGDRWVPEKVRPGEEGMDYLAGQRNVDHRDVYELFPDDVSGMSGDDRMHALVNAGFIRVSPGGGELGMEIHKPMTAAQVSTVMRGARDYESVGVDVVDEAGTTVSMHHNWQQVGVSHGSVINEANAVAAGKTPPRRADAVDLEQFAQRFHDVETPPVRGGAQDWTKGKGGLFTGSRPGGPKLISPAAMGEQTPAAGPGAIATDDPTRFENLPPELQSKLLAQVEKQFPGATPEQLEANLEAQLELALADPSNNGLTWYNEAGAAAAGISGQYGYPIEASTGAVAALSPQQVWGGNLAAAQYTGQLVRENPLVDRRDIGDDLFAEAQKQLADRGLQNMGAWDGTKRLSDLSSLEAAGYVKARAKAQGLSYVDDVSSKVYKVTWSCGLPGIDDAIRIYRGEEPGDVLNGHKVRSFYNNILGGSNSGGSVTVDTHALSAAVGQKVPAQDKRMVVLQSPSSRQYSVKGAYSIFADAYRNVAKKYNISPEQAQALIWIQWRKTRKTNP